jgi:hypothetical protein
LCYKTEVYDDLIPQILGRVHLGAVTLTQVVSGLVAYPDATFTIARIHRDREMAASRYLRDRDVATLEQMMARLDADEAQAIASTRPSSRPRRWSGSVTFLLCGRLLTIRAAGF